VFQKVTNKAATFQPANFEDGRHLLECVAIEESTHAQYGPGIKWVWRLESYPDREQIVDDRGMPFEFWQFTGTSMGLDRKTGGPTAARKNAQALLGRELDEGEDVNPDDLLKKKALGMVILDENDRLKITKIEPNKKVAKKVEEDEDA